MREALELLFKIKTEGQESIQRMVAAVKGIAGAATEAEKALRGMDAATQRASESVAGAMLKANLLADAVTRAAAAIKSYTMGAAQYAARTETLGVVMAQLARVNNLNVASVRAQAEEVRRLGITTQEAMAAINRMIFAQLDLKKATDLARLAQNAAVIAGINSSEALAGIVHGIVTRQPQVLRTYGIVVDFERAFAKAARERGRELAAAEKQQIALNEVLAQGVKIAGAYEASMLTAGKQMTSLARYADEAKQAIGESLVPVLGKAVNAMTQLAKFTKENSEYFAKLAVGTTALGAAIATLKFVPGPPQVKLPAAAAVGIGAYLLGRPDAVEYYREQGAAAVEQVMRQRAEINRRLAAARTVQEAEQLRRQFEETEEALRTIRTTLADALARVYMERGKSEAFGAEKLARGVALGHGIEVTRGEILEAIRQRKTAKPEGGLFDEEAYRRLVEAELREQAAQQAKRRAEEIQKLVHALDTEGLDPLVRLIANTTHALREVVEKYGPLTQAERMGVQAALRGAYLRQLRRREVPLQDVELLGVGGFVWAEMPPVIQTVEVTEEANQRRVAEVRERALGALRRATAFQERMIRLLSGPGGELEAIERITALRIEAAQREFAITQDRVRYEAEMDQARKDRLVAIAELQRRQLEEYRDAAGRVFDALVSRGGGGLSDLLRGQLLTLQRQIFINLSGELFQRLGGVLGGIVPGQRDAQGRPTFLGRILSGTILGRRDDALRVATDANTQATIQNTTAVVGLTRAISGARVGGDGAAAPWFDVGDIDFAGGSTQSGAGRQSWWARHQRAIGMIGVGAAGALGIYAAAREGGARGAVGAAGAAAGAAGTMLSVAGVSGPLAPILAGIGLGLGFVHALFGDPRRARAEEIERRLSEARYSAPEALDRSYTIRGAEVDYDFRGRIRITHNQPITVNISALDAKSVLDRSFDIAQAVRRALQDGHPLAAQIHHAIGANQ